MHEPVKQPVKDQNGDYVCKHGTAMDVHCCFCHNGFIFDRDHVCEDHDDDTDEDDDFENDLEIEID